MLEVPLAGGSMLAIIEDVTGVGKTEAALLLAGRLMQARKADRLFFAPPTMATTNANCMPSIGYRSVRSPKVLRLRIIDDMAQKSEVSFLYKTADR